MDGLSEDDKTKMRAAQVLINEKRYSEARALLAGINHPRATDWIMKIDGILAAMPKPAAKKPSAWSWIIPLLIVISIIAALGYAWYSSDAKASESARRYVCNLQYPTYSDAWSNCMTDRH